MINSRTPLKNADELANGCTSPTNHENQHVRSPLEEKSSIDHGLNDTTSSKETAALSLTNSSGGLMPEQTNISPASTGTSGIADLSWASNEVRPSKSFFNHHFLVSGSQRSRSLLCSICIASHGSVSVFFPQLLDTSVLLSDRVPGHGLDILLPPAHRADGRQLRGIRLYQSSFGRYRGKSGDGQC